MDRTGQIFEGRYRLQRLLGQGGMASVYSAQDRKLGKSVAVKVLSPAYAAVPKTAQRFVQEARAVSRIQHPNVIDVTDFGVAGDGAAYLVMEQLRGEDLAATLRREGPLPWPRLGLIALQICAALDVAHRVGVIHRDIKPSNCFRVHSPGNPDFIKVLDFGIAKVLDPRRSEVEPTTAGTVLGTPEYMAPEVASGQTADARADVYALGAMLYKLITGTALFTGETYMNVLAKQMFDAPQPPRERAPARDIPEAVEALLLRALAKDPAARFQGMAEFAAAIADALPGKPAVDLWISGGAEATQSFTAGQPGDLSDTTGSKRQGAGGEVAATPPASPRRVAPIAVAATLATAALATWIGVFGRGDRGPPAAPAPAAETPALADRSPPAAPEDAPGPTVGGAVADGAPPAVPAGVPDPTSPAVPADSSETSGPADPASDPPPTVSSGERAARRPGFDAAAARRQLGDATAAIQGCAYEFSMHRGEIALTVKIDDDGRVRRVAPAQGSRKVEPGAVACMRRALERLRFPPAAGEVVRVYTF